MVNCPSEEMVSRFMAAGCSRYEASVLEFMARIRSNINDMPEQHYGQQVEKMLKEGKTYIECANWIKAQQ